MVDRLDGVKLSHYIEMCKQLCVISHLKLDRTLLSPSSRQSPPERILEAVCKERATALISRLVLRGYSRFYSHSVFPGMHKAATSSTNIFYGCK